MLALAAGLGAIALALLGDLVAGEQIQLGTLQWVLVAAGTMLLGLALLRGWALRWHARGTCVAVAAYVALLALEVLFGVVLARPTHRVSPLLSLRGSVRPAAWGGYELTPGWRGTYDDGHLQADVAVNDRGDRDRPPDAHAAARRRVLLLGDSFAFGWGLGSHETIDAQIEAASHGEVAAYNLGVFGYGPGDTLAHFRERDLWPDAHVFFLMYENDLRIDNCEAGCNVEFRGVIVPRRRADGALYTEAELAAWCAQTIERAAGGLGAKLKSHLALTSIRSRVAQLSEDHELRFPAHCVEAAAHHTAAMWALARERGQRFTAIPIPTREDVGRQRYSRQMLDFLGRLRSSAVPVQEVMACLQEGDYFVHDEHLSPAGAAKLAAAVLEAIE